MLDEGYINDREYFDTIEDLEDNNRTQSYMTTESTRIRAEQQAEELARVHARNAQQEIALMNLRRENNNQNTPAYLAGVGTGVTATVGVLAFILSKMKK